MDDIAPKPEMDITIGNPQARSVPEHEGEGTLTHVVTHSPVELPSIVKPALSEQQMPPVQIVSITSPTPVYIGRPMTIPAEPWDFKPTPNNRDTLNRVRAPK